MEDRRPPDSGNNGGESSSFVFILNGVRYGLEEGLEHLAKDVAGIRPDSDSKVGRAIYGCRYRLTAAAMIVSFGALIPSSDPPSFSEGKAVGQKEAIDGLSGCVDSAKGAGDEAQRIKDCLNLAKSRANSSVEAALGK